MTVSPSLVVGVGTSGAFVVSGIERIFYEVLGDTKLDLFQLLVVETDDTPRDFEIAPSGRISNTVDAFEQDLGKAITDLDHFLGPEFAWCPKDLTLGAGRGAGNVRAGGRLMFHSKFKNIYRAVQRGMQEAAQQVARNSTNLALQTLFRSRGLESPANMIDPMKTVTYVVGTLAGGTCSGMCVDLGYAIKQNDRQAERIGIFFVPDNNQPDTFKQNSWAAMKDLEYFTDHPDAFRGVWFSEQRTAFRYTAGPAKPYDRIYFVSNQNEGGQARLEYRASIQSPLFSMVANVLAADMLGLYKLRSGKLVNLNEHVTRSEKHRTFLNMNVRGVSYPKYEISESAACGVVARAVCANWLDEKRHVGRDGSQAAILEDNIRGKGRDLWNEKFDGVWGGAGRSVDLSDIAQRIIEGNTDNPSKDLRREFTSKDQGTVYSKVAQTMPTRLDAIKEFIETGLRSWMEDSLNLRCAELFLEGLKGEIDLTLRYWEALGVPTKSNATAWSGYANTAVDALLEGRESLPTKLLMARPAVVQDGLLDLRTKLSMHLMTEVLRDASAWIASDRIPWVRGLRRTLEDVRSIASDRSTQIVQRLRDDRSGPVLRVSRSKTEGFDVEVQRLVEAPNGAMKLPFLEIFANVGGDEIARARRIFLRLKNDIQPELLRALVAKGYVNIAQQLRDQDQVGQASIYLRHAREMSLPTQHTLQKAYTAVPSYIIAKDDFTAQELKGTIQQAHIPGLEEMETKSLPMFDHMVLFYQEGVEFEPDELDNARVYQESYQARMKVRPDYLSPLGYMRDKVNAAKA